MDNLINLEKKINSELATKIKKTEIKHDQIYIEIDKDDLIETILFLKTNKDTKFRQLIDVTVVDYPEQTQRCKVVYLFLSHEFNQRSILSYFINENEVILKKLGRINNILDNDLEKPAATMVVSGDLFKIYFDKDVDLKLIKENLTNKQNRIQEEMNKISQRLENKSFVDRAPKEIVQQEKTNYNNLKNDIDKILVTIKGI